VRGVWVLGAYKGKENKAQITVGKFGLVPMT
jgi:hypothetical protein